MNDKENKKLVKWFLEPINRGVLKARAALYAGHAENEALPIELREQARNISELYASIVEPVESALNALRTANSQLWHVYRIVYAGGGRMRDAAEEMGIKLGSVSANNISLIKTVLRYFAEAGFTVIEGKLYRNGEPIRSSDIVAFHAALDEWEATRAREGGEKNTDN